MLPEPGPPRTRVERVKRGELVAGECEVEDVEVLSDAKRHASVDSSPDDVAGAAES